MAILLSIRVVIMGGEVYVDFCYISSVEVICRDNVEGNVRRPIRVWIGEESNISLNEKNSEKQRLQKQRDLEARNDQEGQL